MRKYALSPFLMVFMMGVSSLGSSLTAFGLGVWNFRLTGSYASMALVGIASPLAIILTAPIAGYAADTYSKRLVLIVSDVVSFVCVIMTLALYAAGLLNTLTIALVVLVLAIVNEFRYTSSSSLIPQICNSDSLIRVNSVQQIFRGSTLMLGPLLGAVGFNLLGLPLLLLTDGSTFACSALFMFSCIPNFVGNKPLSRVNNGFVEGVKDSLGWVRKQKSLVVLLCFFLMINAAISIFMVALAPYVLAQGTSFQLGSASAAMGGGMFLVGLVLSRLKVRLNSFYLLFGGVFALGFSFALIGATALGVPLWLLTPAVGGAISAVAVANQTIWQLHTPAEIQGRVIALRSVAMYLLAPISVLVSVPLVGTVSAEIIKSFPILEHFWAADLTGELGLLISSLGAALVGVGACCMGNKDLRTLV
ncbi:MFS transporter [Pseudomonas sp. TE3610]